MNNLIQSIEVYRKAKSNQDKTFGDCRRLLKSKVKSHMPRLRAMSQGRQHDLANKPLAKRKGAHQQGKLTRYNKVSE